MCSVRCFVYFFFFLPLPNRLWNSHSSFGLSLAARELLPQMRLTQHFTAAPLSVPSKSCQAFVVHSSQKREKIELVFLVAPWGHTSTRAYLLRTESRSPKCETTIVRDLNRCSKAAPLQKREEKWG